MDEATSALEKDSELAVNLTIQQLNITRVIIAHRESTIAIAERVIIMGDNIGRLANMNKAYYRDEYINKTKAATGCFSMFLLMVASPLFLHY